MFAAGRPRIAHASALAALATLATLAALAAALAPARAIPIGVRAKTHVELEHRRGPNGVTLVGRLLDDASEPVATERITLELPGLAPVTRLTDGDGRFEVPLSAKEVNRLRRDGELVLWTVRFDGNSRLGDTAEEGTLDLSKRSTRLTITIRGPDGAEGPVVLGERPVDVTVALFDVSDATPRPIARAEVSLEVGSGSQLVGATGRSGGATFVVRPNAFSSGGRYRVTARFAGDSLHAASRAESELAMLVPTRVTLRVVREGDEHVGRYRMSGRVSDQNGPLAGKVVAITGRHDAGSSGAPPPSPSPSPDGASPDAAPPSTFELAAATDADGVFVTALTAVELQALREGLAGPRERVRLEVRARFAAGDERHAPSESAPVILDVPPPPGVPLRWYLLGLGLVIGFVALARAVRSGALVRAWLSIVAGVKKRLERLLGKRPQVVDVGPDPVFVTRFEPPGDKRARTSDVLSGIVVDAHTRVPLRGVVVARSTNERREVVCDPRGAFRLGPLPAGAWLVTVEAPGHLAREVAVEVPHNGDYDGAQWAIVAVHRTVRDIFAGALDELGAPLAWGYATPREASRDALDNLARPRLTGHGGERADVEPPLAELTHLVEETHFAPRIGTVAHVERARSLKQALAALRPPEPARADDMKAAAPPADDGDAPAGASS